MSFEFGMRRTPQIPLVEEPEEIDVDEEEAEAPVAREAFPEHYIKLIAYDATYGRQTTALAFIVNRPSVEKPFTLDRIQGPGRVHRFRLVGGGPANGRVEVPAAVADGKGGEAA